MLQLQVQKYRLLNEIRGYQTPDGGFSNQAGATAGTMGEVARAAQAVDWSDTLQLVPGLAGVPRDEALDHAASQLGVDADAVNAVAGQLLAQAEGDLVAL